MDNLILILQPEKEDDRPSPVKETTEADSVDEDREWDGKIERLGGSLCTE